MDLKTLLDYRIQEQVESKRRLERALEATGQKSLRFPELWEDTISLAANAARALFELCPHSIKKLRYIIAGTETSLDFSKPLSSWVQGCLEQIGLQFPSNISNFQVQHACAGGTLALLSGAGLLALSDRKDESALILASDIARYACPSSAEFTQGAGAAALLLDHDAKLFRLDLEHLGQASASVDDFFRPLNSLTAQVKGQYSITCYHQAAENAFLDFCSRAGLSTEEVFRQHDYLVFHVPFAKMAYTAARHLLSRFNGLVDGEIDKHLESRGFFEPLEYCAQIGNTYTVSVWFALAATVYTQYKKLGPAIEGKKVLLSSYGSGNVMQVISLQISEGACEIIKKWDLDALVADYKEADIASYKTWISREAACPAKASDLTDTHTFFLEDLRQDGYRIYGYK